jgi:hypothetical protein
MTSTVTTHTRTEAGDRSMKMESSSRWIGPDCGEVKPPQ